MKSLMSIGVTREVGCTFAKKPRANDVLGSVGSCLLGGCGRALPNKPCCLISELYEVKKGVKMLQAKLKIGALTG
ncbi:MAG: hypothetical protein ACREYE_32150 [Gammaproteobacteria bacterium]